MAESNYHHGDLKNALITAGVEILAHEGIGSLSLRSVARRAGVSHSAPYAHFADKQALIAAISTEGFRRLHAQLEAAILAEAGHPAQQLTACGRAYIRFATDQHDIFKIMFSGIIEKEKEYADFVETSQATFRLLVKMVEDCQAAGVLRPAERAVYRLCGVDSAREMGWRAYALALLAFNLLGGLALYALLRLQGHLPLNPLGLPGMEPALALNVAASFATNTNWQPYSGEASLGLLVPMLGLTVQNFLSAASGLACLMALVRGLARRESRLVGNFWVDLVRAVLYVLLPLAFLFSLAWSPRVSRPDRRQPVMHLHAAGASPRSGHRPGPAAPMASSSWGQRGGSSTPTRPSPETHPAQHSWSAWPSS